MENMSFAGKEYFETFGRGDYHRCLELYTQMLQADPHLLILLAPAQAFLISCQRTGQIEVAESFGAKMIENRETAIPALADFMRIHLRWEADLLRLTLGQAEKKDISKGVETDDQRFQVCYYAAARLLTQERTDDAREELEKCLTLPVPNCLELQLARYDLNRVLAIAAEELSEQFARLVREHDLAGALRAGRQLVSVSRTVHGEDSPQFCLVADNLAHASYLTGDLTGAETLWRQSADLIRAKVGDQDPLYAERLGKLALVCERVGAVDEAVRLHSQAESIFDRHIADPQPERAEDLGRCLHELGKFHDDGGDYPRAERYYYRALDVRRKALGSSHPDTATSLIRLADLHRVLGLHETAEPLLREAAEVTRQLTGEDSVQYAARLNSMGMFYLDLGDIDQGETQLQRALKICRRLHGEYHPDVADLHLNLGQHYRRIGDHNLALEATQHAVEVFRRVGTDEAGLAIALNNLAGLHSLACELDIAKTLYQEAMELQQRALGERHPKVADTQANLAAVLMAQGNASAAEPLLFEAIETIRARFGERNERYGVCLHNFAHLHLLRSEFAAAEDVLRAAAMVKEAALGADHPELIGTLLNLACVVEVAGRPEEALDILSRISAIEDQHLGRVFRVGSSRQRLDHLQLPFLNLNLFLSIVRRHFSDQARPVGAAWDLLLKRKGLAAEASCTQRDVVLGGKYPQLREKVEELAAVRWTIARRSLDEHILAGSGDGHEELASWMARAESLEAELARAIPELQLDQRLRAVCRRDVAAALPSDTALVEYVRFRDSDLSALLRPGDLTKRPDRYAAFVVRPDSPEDVQFVDLGEAPDIDRLVARFRSSITGETGGRHLGILGTADTSACNEDFGTALRIAVFDPVRSSALSRARRLTIVPDGDLYLIPFEVIPDGAGGFLIDHYRFSYLDTGRDLLRTGRMVSGLGNGAVVVADPDFDLGSDREGEKTTTPAEPVPARSVAGVVGGVLTREGISFPRLSGTHAEGERVSALLGVRPWLAGEALERRLKAHRSPLVLHLATHGFFLKGPSEPSKLLSSEERPLKAGGRLSGERLANPLLRSGLALAGANVWLRGGTLPDEAEDGLLTAEDVAGLDLLDTELAVLSACQTGLGDLRQGEGVFGLRRAFLLAGAKTLVMSLWKVPDLATAILMEQFYHHLLNHGSERDLALRESQRYLRDLTVGQIRSTWLTLRMSDESSDSLSREIQRLVAFGNDHRPFAAPACWGAFICQGDTARLSRVGLCGHFTPDGTSRQSTSNRDMLTRSTSDDAAQTITRVARLISQAMQLGEQDRFEQGLELGHQALELSRQELGPMHRETGSSINAVAGLYQVMGRFGDAEPLLREALDVARFSLGNDDPTVAVALANLAGILQRLDRPREAIPLLRESLELLQRTVSSDDLGFARNALFLAQVHASLGEESEAEALIQPALATLQGSLGVAHPRYVHTLQSLAAAFYRGQRPKAAERWQLAIVEFYREHLGDGHSDTINALGQLAAFQIERGDLFAADMTLEQALRAVPLSMSDVALRQRLQLQVALTELALKRQNHDLAETRYQTLKAEHSYISTLEEPHRALVLSRAMNLAAILGKTVDAQWLSQLVNMNHQ